MPLLIKEGGAPLAFLLSLHFTAVSSSKRLHGCWYDLDHSHDNLTSPTAIENIKKECIARRPEVCIAPHEQSSLSYPNSTIETK